MNGLYLIIGTTQDKETCLSVVAGGTIVGNVWDWEIDNREKNEAFCTAVSLAFDQHNISFS